MIYFSQISESPLRDFLQTLCGHVRVFRERHEPLGPSAPPRHASSPATFVVGDAEEEGNDGAALASSSRYDLKRPHLSRNTGWGLEHIAILTHGVILLENPTSPTPKIGRAHV